MAVPLEILAPAVGLLLVTVWTPDRKLLLHPVLLATVLGLGWVLVTAMTSIDSVVSLKYALARVVYVVAFFGGGLVVLTLVKTRGVVAAGLAGFLPVVAWTVWHHASTAFAFRTSIEVGAPFFPNHLEYGATLVFWMLVLLGLALARRERLGRFGGTAGMVFLVLLPVLWAAHSRSAWLALIAGLGLFFLIRLGVGPRSVMVVVVVGLVVYLGLFAGYFLRAVPDDRLSIHRESRNLLVIEDPSFNERLNRWSCALRMAQERPGVGFGPGTYEGSYGVFQDFREMTSHSSLSGGRGDAHSEFFSAMAEQGVVGLMLVVLLFGFSIATGLNAVEQGRDQGQRWIALGWTAAVVSLAVGNLLSSFFEVDRVAPLMWLACAAVVVMERSAASTSPGNH